LYELERKRKEQLVQDCLWIVVNCVPSSGPAKR